MLIYNNCRASTVQRQKSGMCGRELRPARLMDDWRGERLSSEYIMDTLQSSQQACVRGQGVVNLANRTRVVLAGLDIPLQQLDHDGLGQVAGGASLSRRRCVVECLHVVLVEAERVSIENKRYEC